MMTVTLRIAAAMALTLALSGCVPLLIGGAAAGGYYVGKDERSAGEIADDVAITTAVKTRLIGEEMVRARDINVDTHLKVVTLRGTVRSDAERRRAIEIAARTGNVERVVDELEVR